MFDPIPSLRVRVAALAIGPSTLRNMVGPGGVTAAQNFCSRNAVLTTLSNSRSFSRALNRLTVDLAAAMPEHERGGNRWGPARKSLNIFLSDASQNFQLRRAYALNRIEASLEIPLDSYVARGLRRDARDLGVEANLGRWRGVVHVSPESNAEHQRVASVIARRLGFRYRAQLDLRYWRGV